jgi:aldose 1-epimerase
MVESTEPAFQFYTGGFVDVPESESESGQKVPARRGRSGFCVEPSRYVDAAGRKEWRGMCLLKKGQLFGSKTKYTAWKE